MNRYLLPAMSLLLAVLGACSKNGDYRPVPMGYDYFPVAPGHWIEYRVDSVLINGVFRDTTHWVVKDVFDTAYWYSGDWKNCWITRQARPADSQIPWSVEKRLASVSLTEATLTAGNHTWLKLVFPVTADSHWDGNAYNAGEMQEYTVSGFGESLGIDGVYYENTITVIEYDLQTLISERTASEVYAPGIGMISLQSTDLQNIHSPQFTTGYITTYRIIACAN